MRNHKNKSGESVSGINPKGSLGMESWDAETLWRYWCTSKEEKYRTALILKSEKMVLSFLKTHYWNKDLREELRQAGSVAVVEAFAKYDPSKGMKWTTFVFDQIHWAIYKELGKNNIFSNPKVGYAISLVQRVYDQLKRENQMPDYETVQQKLKQEKKSISQSILFAAYQYVTCGTVSLNTPMSEDSYYEPIFQGRKEFETVDIQDEVEFLLSKISNPLYRALVQERMAGKSIKYLAEKYNFSRQWVDKICKEAIQQMQKTSYRPL